MNDIQTEVFVIGGAVRSVLLNEIPKDIDYVWVGAIPQDLIDQGMTQVGNDFPVFLDNNGHEHALARKERKNGVGYLGFECEFDTSVTLKEDQSRRDLTVNQFAVKLQDWDIFVKTQNVNLIIDPFNGQEDLKNGILRHVSDAFKDDPVRVLRVARFASRYNFEVHEDTKQLMKDMVNAGELDHLTPERVWAEFAKAMMEDFPNRFFWELEQCGAIDVLFPELKRIIIFSGVVLDRAVLTNATLVERCMVFFSNVQRDMLNYVCERLKMPNEIKVMSMKHNRFMEAMDRKQMDAQGMLNLMHELDLFRNPGHMISMGKMGVLNDKCTKVFTFMKAFRAARNVTFAMLSQHQQETLQGADIGKAIDVMRLEVI